MAIKDNFLREVKIGDRVELMIGSKEMDGMIIALDLETVRIRRKNGKEPVLSLNSISYYEVGGDELKSETESIDLGTTKAVEEVKKEETTQLHMLQIELPNTTEDKSILSAISATETKEQNNLESVFQQLLEQGNSFFEFIETPIVKSIKDVANMTEHDWLRNEIYAISNSLDYAMNQAHEVSPADYKIQENIGKIKRLIRNNPHLKTPSNLLGAVYFRCKCDGLAMEAYENGDDNESAFAIAERLHNEDKKLSFAARHFAIDKRANAYIYKYLLENMINLDDYSLCTQTLIKGVTSEKSQAYHSFMRAILLVNHITYNVLLDYDITEASLEDLMRIIKSKIIGKKNELATRLPAEKVVKPQETEKDMRTLEECPIFAAAEHARQDEKDLIKAEKLYIQAIRNNEKPGSAVANLYQILVPRKQYKECAMYLGRYGSKYMREEAYNNLKRHFFLIAPNMRSEVEKYEKEDSIKIDYFFLAQKAEVEEKDLQKAITYYKKAIESKRRLNDAISNLVSIYIRLEMYSDALELLEKDGKSVINTYTYLNLKQSILIQAKDKRYIGDIEETFSQLIKMTTSLERMTEIAASSANLLFQIEEYDKAIAIYEYCLKNCEKKKYSRDKRDRQKINVLMGLCNSYIHKNELSLAHEYAVKIIKIDKKNEFAKSILSGNIINEEATFIEENIGMTHINKYIQKHIDELSLDAEVKYKNSLKEGTFIGDQEMASNILNSILDQINRSVNDEAKSNQYLAGAKLIRQIFERNETNEIIDSYLFDERRFLFFVAEGTCSYANSRLYRTELADNLDVARYFYIQPISIYNESEKWYSCWGVSTIRYIQTYFVSVDSIRKEGNRISQRNKDHNSCMLTIQKIMQNPIKIKIDIFTIGMIELLTYNTRIKKSVLSYINTNAFQGKILDVLAKILKTEVPDISTIDDLEKVWDKAAVSYYAQRKAFLHLITETIDSLFAVGQLQENFEKVKRNSFMDFLNSTDREYVHNLCEIFAKIERYNEIGEFDYKAETLKQADDIRKNLEEKISEYPTYLSYEKLLQRLGQIQIKILKESVNLYTNSEPQLSVILSGDCTVEVNKMIVRVPIAYTNKANVQNADNVQMIVYGGGVEEIENTILSRALWIGDGQTNETLLTFKISDKILEEQVFSIDITILYQYKKNMTEIKDASAKFVLTVPLTRELVEPIKNNFEIISSGEPVHDKNMFFGRDKVIASIIDQITHSSIENKSGKCLALYGQTRTGKSSVLYHLQVQLREQGEQNIIIDMNSLGELKPDKNNITDFLYKLLRTLNKEIRKNHVELACIMKEHGIVIDEQLLLTNKEQSQLRFNEIFDNVYEFIKEQEKSYHIVLMIDEFTYIYDWIRQNTMTDRIMKFWKAFMQTYNVYAIIIGQDHMMQFMSDQRFTNDFGIMKLIKVSYLSKDNAQKLMDKPILYVNKNGEAVSRYKKGALDRLYELTSGSAYLIGKVCAGLVEYLNEINSIFITVAHINEYIKKMLPSFEEIIFDPQYRDLSDIGENSTIIERNKAILKRIAVFSNKKEYTPIEAVIQSEGDREILDKLEQRDVIKIERERDRCKIKVVLYKEWLIEKYGLGVLK